MFESKVALAPDRLGYAWLGRTHHAVGETDAAIDAYIEAANLGEIWYGYMAIGDLYFRRGDYELTKEWYFRAQRIYPDVLLINVRLGDIALREGHHEQAWSYFQIALDQAPDHPLPR